MSTEEPIISRKSRAFRNPKKSATHPLYPVMIKEAIVSLGERKGLSRYAIGKFIEEKHKGLSVNFWKLLLTRLKELVAADKLVKVKASYKLPSVKRKPKATLFKKKSYPVTLEEISKHYGKSIEEAARHLGISRSTLKRRCRSFGVSRWPYKTNKSDSHTSNFRRSNEHNPAIHTEHVMHSSTHVLNQEQAQAVLINKLAQPGTAIRNSEKLVTIKATYQEDTVRFLFIPSDGFVKLEEHIATRFRLDIGAFSLKYADKDGDMILIACDSSLDVAVDDFRQPDCQTVIRLAVCPLVN